MYIAREKIIKLSLIATIFVLCGMIVSIILMGINQFRFGSQLASINQVSNLSYVLVRQQANLLSLLLVRKAQTDELEEALDNFANEEFVIDVNIYSLEGKLLAKSKNTVKFDVVNTLNNSQTTQQIVEPILNQQELVGFLRVTFDTQYNQSTKNRIEQLFYNLYGELIVLFLAGVLFASCFYALLRRKTAHILPPTKSNIDSMKSQTQRFHSRRRRFSA